MAEVLQCDLCGKVYKKNDLRFQPDGTVKKIGQVERITVGYLATSGSRFEKTIDLCDDCLDRIFPKDLIGKYYGGSTKVPVVREPIDKEEPES